NLAGRSEDSEDRRIGMVEADGVDAVEAVEIVFVRCVVAMPCDDIKRRVIELRGPKVAKELCDNLEAAVVSIVEGGIRSQEVTRVCETVGPYRAEVGKT